MGEAKELFPKKRLNRTRSHAEEEEDKMSHISELSEEMPASMGMLPKTEKAFGEKTKRLLFQRRPNMEGAASVLVIYIDGVIGTVMKHPLFDPDSKKAFLFRHNAPLALLNLSH